MQQIRAINGYELKRFYVGERWGIFVIYTINGEFFTRSKYYEVNNSKVKKICKKLDDFTKMNQEATELCQTISMVTIISTIDKIVFDN